MKIHLILLAFILAILSARSSHAQTTVEKNFSCPIDGETWTKEMSAPGKQIGQRLDHRPFGPVTSPWELGQCPKCRYVIYSHAAAEAPTGELRAYILSPAYQTAAKDQPTHHCAALIQTFLKESPYLIGLSHLRASWQTENNPQECRKHLEAAYAAVAAVSPEHRDFVPAAFLSCELARRTERFDDARQRCQSLLQHERVKNTKLQLTLQRQLEFIAKQDSTPHAALPEQEVFVAEVQ